MKKFLFVSFVVLLVTVKPLYCQSFAGNNGSVTITDLKEWINMLASDDMRGRMTGSVESHRASEWIAGKFKEYGVAPMDNLDSYFQPYDVKSRGRSFVDRNVIGIIPGEDAALLNQYIVISAHFDHVGVRDPVEGDSIYNGADDNAAGTCALIGIAKDINNSVRRPGRTIILAAFSGEEMGLIGSGYFVKNLPVDPESLYTNINFEMIGHSEYLGKGNYYMTGINNSNLDDVISDYSVNSGFTLVDTIPLAERLFYMSDNLSFARMQQNDDILTGIPCGTFATTTMGDYIHTPGDEASLFDFENMTGLVNYFSDVVLYLSNYKGEINWTSDRFRRPPLK